MRLQDRLLALLQRVEELSGHAHKQLGSLYTAEVRLHKMDNWFADSAACHVCRQVDIDIQLRACAGSCCYSESFGADHRGCRAPETDMEQLKRRLGRTWSSVTPLDRVPQIHLLHPEGAEPSCTETI